jgi:hypothetical protein
MVGRTPSVPAPTGVRGTSLPLIYAGRAAVQSERVSGYLFESRLGPGSANLGSRCLAGWLAIGLPTRGWGCGSLMVRLPLGIACEEWLERDLPRSK